MKLEDGGLLVEGAVYLPETAANRLSALLVRQHVEPVGFDSVDSEFCDAIDWQDPPSQVRVGVRLIPDYRGRGARPVGGLPVPFRVAYIGLDAHGA